MLKKLLVAIAVGLVLFLGYVSTRPGHFKYERSGLIQAKPQAIFPYLHDFKKGAEWSPYEKMDTAMQHKYSGPATGVGSIMEFESNKAGSGKLEILNEVPNQIVELRLEMLKPFHSKSLVVYQLTPEAGGTRFTWTMSGDETFFSKLFGVFVDCEKMVGGQFEEGIQSLKTLVEAKKTSH